MGLGIYPKRVARLPSYTFLRKDEHGMAILTSLLGYQQRTRIVLWSLIAMLIRWQVPRRTVCG